MGYFRLTFWPDGSESLHLSPLDGLFRPVIGQGVPSYISKVAKQKNYRMFEIADVVIREAIALSRSESGSGGKNLP